MKWKLFFYLRELKSFDLVALIIFIYSWEDQPFTIDNSCFTSHWTEKFPNPMMKTKYKKTSDVTILLILKFCQPAFIQESASVV